ncbi:hypothetical protein H8E65_10005 [Candidatus Bathyarchaeota archaeon]|nr:hypothetical protein [Candidatus Bathyarchaeota archaeon]MBL7080426.1 hypothetical protein [Candidatus Bathyarchaeota archaeon]
MGFERNFDEKMDVMDLIINVLKDHESKLDELVSRLESLPPHQEGSEEDSEPEYEPQRPVVGPPRQAGPVVTAILKRWTDFRSKCASSRLVAFDTEESVFEVSALAGGVVYVYREEVPSMGITYREDGEGARVEGIDISKPGLMPAALREKLDCGLEFTRRDLETNIDNGRTLHKIVFEIDPVVARSWIAYQLGVDDSDVVQGKLQK